MISYHTVPRFSLLYRHIAIAIAALLTNSFPNIELAMSALLDPSTPLNAVAVDTLAAGLITNSLGANAVRQSGKIDDQITYGFLVSASASMLPSALPNLNLAECLGTLVHAGPFQLSALPYFRQYAAVLQFSQNADLVDRTQQEDVARNAMIQAAYILPLSTLGFLLFAFYFNRGWDRRRLRASEQPPPSAGLTGQEPFAPTLATRSPAATASPSGTPPSRRLSFPSASRLPPLTRGDDDDDD